jgi:hypothetical protein
MHRWVGPRQGILAGLSCFAAPLPPRLRNRIFAPESN